MKLQCSAVSKGNNHYLFLVFNDILNLLQAPFVLGCIFPCKLLQWVPAAGGIKTHDMMPFGGIWKQQCFIQLACIGESLPQASRTGARPACGWAWRGCKTVRRLSSRGTHHGSSTLTTGSYGKGFVNILEIFKGKINVSFSPGVSLELC